MKFLNDTACAAWCEAHNYAVRKGMYGHHVPDFDDARFRFRDIPYPSDSGRRVGLAKDVIASCSVGSSLVWVVEFGIWPSSEHRPLYDRFRESLGGTGGLAAGSGHLLEDGDRNDAVSLVLLGLMFFWDVYVLPEQAGPTFFSSHDEYAGLYLHEGSDEIPQQLSAWLAEVKRIPVGTQPSSSRRADWP